MSDGNCVLPSSRAEALRLNAKSYWTGKQCAKGHVARRYTQSSTCAECVSSAFKTWASKNPEKNKVRDTRYEENPEMERARARDWYARNADSINAKKRANPKSIEYARTWQRRNKGRVCAISAARRASILSATPKWADLNEIAKVYAAAVAITKETGIQHDVDHLVPLRGKNVCGLHVHYNLRVITREENAKKGNRFDELLLDAN